MFKYIHISKIVVELLFLNSKIYKIVLLWILKIFKTSK